MVYFERTLIGNGKGVKKQWLWIVFFCSLNIWCSVLFDWLSLFGSFCKFQIKGHSSSQQAITSSRPSSSIEWGFAVVSIKTTPDFDKSLWWFDSFWADRIITHIPQAMGLSNYEDGIPILSFLKNLIEVCSPKVAITNPLLDHFQKSLFDRWSCGPVKYSPHIDSLESPLLLKFVSRSPQDSCGGSWHWYYGPHEGIFCTTARKRICPRNRLLFCRDAQ